MSLHIYSEPSQPTRCFIDRNFDPAETFTMHPRAALRTDCCHKLRWAQYVVVQVFYDGLRRWCSPGRGCKAVPR
jgi:hypothetical protein